MPTSVKKNEGLYARGDLRVAIRCAKTGHTIRRMQIKNTITMDGLTALVEVFRQTVDPASFKFTSLRVGTDGRAPLRGDTGLYGEVTSIQLTKDSFSESRTGGPFEIRVRATLAKDQANGVTLQEAAIGMGTDVPPKIFSRQTHPGIPKTEALLVDYDWRITITA